MSEQGDLTRRRFMGVAGAAAASVLAPGLAGCAGGDSGGSSTSSGSGGGDRKITLTWWDYFNDANEKAVNARIAAYQEGQAERDDQAHRAAVRRPQAEAAAGRDRG